MAGGRGGERRRPWPRRLRGPLALAKRRLPHWQDRFCLGNALSWTPDEKFDFVLCAELAPKVAAWGFTPSGCCEKSRIRHHEPCKRMACFDKTSHGLMEAS